MREKKRKGEKRERERERERGKKRDFKEFVENKKSRTSLADNGSGDGVGSDRD